MEEESWEQTEEGVGEEWNKEEELIEDVVEDGNWNKEDFKEDVVSGQKSTPIVESVVEEEKIEWGTPSQLETEDNLEYVGRGSRRPYSIRSRDVADGLRKIRIGEVFTVNVGFGQTLRRMVRESWGAAKPGGRGTLRSPISKIRFTQTGTKYCATSEECMQHCRDLQKYYMDLGFPDIPYNFMIGGDGVLYHGRGWSKQADRSPAFHRLKKSCLDIAYIGDFIEKKIPYEMLATAADFLKYGLKVARITPFFQSFTFLSDARRS